MKLKVAGIKPILFFLFSLSMIHHLLGQDSDRIFLEIEKKYNIEVISEIDDFYFPKEFLTSPMNARAEEIDENELLRLPRILKIALSKYPVRVVKNNLKKIYLAKRLFLYNTTFAGTYSLDSIYLCNRGEEAGYTDSYLISLFHHEFSSILFDNYNFPVEKWKLCNLKRFEYKYEGYDRPGGIVAALKNDASLDGTEELYRQGFLNEFSKSEISEDFSEFSALILTEPKEFKDLIAKYPIIRKKFKVWLEFYHSIDKIFTQDYVLETLER